MRARLKHRLNHPNLGEFKPELLQLAAQMSMQTQDLSRAYSDQKVERAHLFLRQRHEEAEAMADRLTLAVQTCNELRRWMADIDTKE